MGSRRQSQEIDLPKSDVIQWRLEDDTLVTVRPSGTEPKIKFYILCHNQSGQLSESKEKVRTTIAQIENDIRAVINMHRR